MVTSCLLFGAPKATGILAFEQCRPPLATLTLVGLHRVQLGAFESALVLAVVEVTIGLLWIKDGSQ